MNQVIIIGSDHHNTLGVIRSLGEKGIKSHLIVYSEHLGKEFVTRSKYLASSHAFAKCDASIIDFLCEEFANEDEPSVLIGTSDAACLLIDNHLERLGSFICANCENKENGISYWMDKFQMNERARQCGLEVPKSVLLRSGYKLDYSQVGFPCIVKPLESAMGNKRDITVCKSKEELSEVLDVFNEQNIDLLIQDFLVAEHEVGIMGCSFYSDGECWIPDIITKIRFSNKSATYAKIEDVTSRKALTETINCLKKLVRQIGYKGIFDIDLLYCNGKYYFIEINLRNGAYGYALSKAGANFVYNWYYDAITGKREVTHNIEPTYLMSEFSDFRSSKRNGISLLQWVKEYLNSIHMILQFRDIKPVGAFLRQKVSK